MSLARAIRDHLLLPAESEDRAGEPSGAAAGEGSAVAAIAGAQPPVPPTGAATASSAARVVFLPPSSATSPATPARPSDDPPGPRAQATSTTGRAAGGRRHRRRGSELPAPPAIDRLALLCGVQDAAVLTAVVGQGLRKLHRAPCAVALVWRSAAGRSSSDATADLPGHWLAVGDGGGAGGGDLRDEGASRRAGHERSAARPARRLAASLTERGLSATAAGRVVSVELPGEDGRTATLAVDRAHAAAGSAPVVLVVAGPRDEWADAALAGCQAVLVADGAGPAGEVARLAEAELAARGLAVASVSVPRGLARPACARGLLLPAGIPRALADLAAAPGAPPTPGRVAA